jgi:hypothetical protein
LFSDQGTRQRSNTRPQATLAISERFIADTGHDMIRRAVLDDCWDVGMVGFNALNPSARERGLAPLPCATSV